MKNKTVCMWESICINCKQIYAVRIAIKNGDEIEKRQSYGYCPECLELAFVERELKIKRSSYNELGM